MKIAKCMLALGAILLSGCATRGSVRVECHDFLNYVTELRPSQLIRDIQSDALYQVDVMPPSKRPFGPRTDEGPDPLAASLRGLMADKGQRAAYAGRDADAPVRPRAVLLLSGGGQWGAFGAGFLRTLQTDPATHVDFGVITGVSTGGLQSLFLAIDEPGIYDQLIRAYSPKDEKQVVKRNAKPLAVLTGSLAGSAPLRKRIEEALCTDGKAANGCPMINALASSGRTVFIGFVEASSGKFLYADATSIAGRAKDGLAQRQNAQQCLTGVALASAAMPVFFQQVKIAYTDMGGRPVEKTFYDGGVRQSVFEQNVADQLDRAIRAERDSARARASTSTRVDVPAPHLYVVRNGPTLLLGPQGIPEDDFAPDRHADALTAAFRAESIVVNQLEVGSIASLRLAHPTDAIRLATADGYHNWLTPAGETGFKGCVKTKDVMFDPLFMQCLQRFGTHKAKRHGSASPWISLSPLDLKDVEPRDDEIAQP